MVALIVMRGGILLTQLGEGNRGEIIPGSDCTNVADKKRFRCNNFGRIACKCTQDEESSQDRKGIGML